MKFSLQFPQTLQSLMAALLDHCGRRHAFRRPQRPQGSFSAAFFLPVWVMLMSVGLLSCSRTEEKPGAHAPQPQPEKKALVLLGMADYFDLELLKQFEKETGVAVEYEEYNEPDEVEPRLRSQPGSADLIIIDSFNLKKLRELRLLYQLDKTLLPNLKNADPTYLDLGCDPGNEVSVPYHWGTTLIAYRKDQLPNPAHSWKLLWDPALKGKVMMLNDSFEPMGVAMILSGFSTESSDSGIYEAAAQMLMEQIDTMDARYGVDAEVKDALAQGTVAAAMCYSGDAAAVAAEEPNVDFFIPEEGAMMWVDCMAITRDTRWAKEAHQFLNFFMRPEVAAANTNAIQYASANAAATNLIDDDLKNDPRIYPTDELKKKLRLVPQLDADREALVNRYWYQDVRRKFMENEGEEEAAPEAETAPEKTEEAPAPDTEPGA